MKLKQIVAYGWIATLVLLLVFVTWQDYPILAASPNLTYIEFLHAQRAVMLKPATLVIWAVLVTTGIIWGWRGRDLWREQRGTFYVFLACSFSVIWFVVLIIFLR